MLRTHTHAQHRSSSITRDILSKLFYDDIELIEFYEQNGLPGISPLPGRVQIERDAKHDRVCTREVGWNGDTGRPDYLEAYDGRDLSPGPRLYFLHFFTFYEIS